MSDVAVNAFKIMPSDFGTVFPRREGKFWSDNHGIHSSLENCSKIPQKSWLVIRAFCKYMAGQREHSTNT